jgi:PAS domain S-box-containing protein
VAVTCLIGWRLNEAMRARVQSGLDSAGEGICGVGRSGRVRFANASAARLPGRDLATLAGRPLHAFLHDGACSGTPCALERVLADGEVYRSAGTRVTRADGSVFPADCVVTPVLERDRCVGAVLVFRDVTERAEADRLKADFVSFVTHQLRTPLAGVKWMIELAAQARTMDDARALLRDASEANERLIRLVNDLLEVAKLESGRLTAVIEPVDHSAVTRDVLGELAGSTANAVHRVEVDVESQPAAVGDRRLLREVVLNLLGNAIKYTPPGGTIRVRLSPAAGGCAGRCATAASASRDRCRRACSRSSTGPRTP